MFLVKMLAGALAGAALGTAGAVAGSAGGTEAPARAAGRTVRIMPLGDSITVGVGSQTKSSYRGDLAARLARTGLSADFVGSQRTGAGFDTDNEGHGGWTIGDLSGHINGWLATYRPNVILLHAGTNNIIRRDAPDQVAAKLSALIDQIRTARPDVRILVSQVVGSKNPTEMRAIKVYNGLIPRMVAAKGAQVQVVDQSTVTGIDLLDIHHPNDFGYTKMSFNFYRALGEVYGTGALGWAAGDNPYLQVSAHRCLWRPIVRDGRTVNFVECRTWSLNYVTVAAYGTATRVRQWQTRRVVTVPYPAIVHGRRVTVYRQALRWFGPEQFLNV